MGGWKNKPDLAMEARNRVESIGSMGRRSKRRRNSNASYGMRAMVADGTLQSALGAGVGSDGKKKKKERVAEVKPLLALKDAKTGLVPVISTPHGDVLLLGSIQHVMLPAGSGEFYVLRWRFADKRQEDAFKSRPIGGDSSASSATSDSGSVDEDSGVDEALRQTKATGDTDFTVGDVRSVHSDVASVGAVSPSKNRKHASKADTQVRYNAVPGSAESRVRQEDDQAKTATEGSEGSARDSRWIGEPHKHLPATNDSGIHPRPGQGQYHQNHRNPNRELGSNQRSAQITDTMETDLGE